MPGIQSQVTFGVGGGGATISVGPVDAEAKKVDVWWNDVLVYSSTTPNQPLQSAIPATAISGTNTLKLIVTFEDRSHVDYTQTYTAAAGTIVVKILNQVYP
ncbi:MAG TPA: hypothetical protein VFY71_02170 [Planctomycetota bacterium]|nr:hypothetical protein [Planctomycetota bacterium]